ncbi:MAG: SCP2 sterol-binding domain-containing protein [Pseudomonadota bacterium]|nr:MAG: sterol-binding protein [Pseudomonadota bacterium]
MYSPLEAFRTVVRRLPVRPPSVALAAALNFGLRPSLTEMHKQMLRHRVVLIGVDDLGVECRVSWDGTRFVAHGRGRPHAVAVRAKLRDFRALLLRQEDADTLFFQRRLRIEGDTEFGLGIKNLLDSVEPPQWLVRLQARFGPQQPGNL